VFFTTYVGTDTFEFMLYMIVILKVQNMFCVIVYFGNRKRWMKRENTRVVFKNLRCWETSFEAAKNKRIAKYTLLSLKIL
jgi:hypothetical protein